MAYGCGRQKIQGRGRQEKGRHGTAWHTGRFNPHPSNPPKKCRVPLRDLVGEGWWHGGMVYEVGRQVRRAGSGAYSRQVGRHRWAGQEEGARVVCPFVSFFHSCPFVFCLVLPFLPTVHLLPSLSVFSFLPSCLSSLSPFRLRSFSCPPRLRRSKAYEDGTGCKKR